MTKGLELSTQEMNKMPSHVQFEAMALGIRSLHHPNHLIARNKFSNFWRRTLWKWLVGEYELIARTLTCSNQIDMDMWINFSQSDDKNAYDRTHTHVHVSNGNLKHLLSASAL